MQRTDAQDECRRRRTTGHPVGVRHRHGGPVSRRRPRSCSRPRCRLIEAQAALEAAKAQLAQAKELASRGGASDADGGRAARGADRGGIQEGPRRRAPDRADQRGQGSSWRNQGEGTAGERPGGRGREEAAREPDEPVGQRSGTRSTTRSRRRLKAGGEDQRPEVWEEKVAELEVDDRQAEEEEGQPGEADREPEVRDARPRTPTPSERRC